MNESRTTIVPLVTRVFHDGQVSSHLRALDHIHQNELHIFQRNAAREEAAFARQQLERVSKRERYWKLGALVLIGFVVALMCFVTSLMIEAGQ